MKTLWALTPALLLLLPMTALGAEPDPCIKLAAAPSTSGPAQPAKKSKQDKTPKLFPLALVICEVEQALDQYQQDVTASPRPASDILPKLATAEFDFKTVTDTKITAGVSFFALKFGGSRA